MGETIIQGDVILVRVREDLAAGIRTVRAGRGKLQMQTAEAAGLSLRILNRIENEFAGSGDVGRKVNPTYDTLAAISRALNVVVVIDNRRQPGDPEGATTPDPPSLTGQQAKVLRAVCGYMRDHDYSPTVIELTEMCGLASGSTLHYHLKALVRKGYIEYGSGPRRIRVLIEPPGGGDGDA